MLTRQLRHLSFLTLQRRNALGDALRHKLVPRCRLKTGRRASRTVCDAERRTMVTELSHQSDSHTPCHDSNTGYFPGLNSFALAAGMDRGTMVRLSNGTS
ncbi:DUF1534 domain-containing protein [Pseudomonas syringae pv. tomato]|nr:DUF1534 domain-containing protein [Pseudomonas syringae pv. tomato]